MALPGSKARRRNSPGGISGFLDKILFTNLMYCIIVMIVQVLSINKSNVTVFGHGLASFNFQGRRVKWFDAADDAKLPKIEPS